MYTCDQADSLLNAVRAENLEASGRLDSEQRSRVQTNPARFWPSPLSSPSRSHAQLAIATTSHLQTTPSLICDVSAQQVRRILATGINPDEERNGVSVVVIIEARVLGLCSHTSSGGWGCDGW